ncbi:MAG: hypothetical protein K8H74_03145 [Notoacmeibacter sp.]|nr:hypothetical protein [Notoacmeibacter sp.]
MVIVHWAREIRSALAIRADMAARPLRPMVPEARSPAASGAIHRKSGTVRRETDTRR